MHSVLYPRELDMTAIIRLHCPDYKSTGLSYGWKFLPPGLGPYNKATGRIILPSRCMHTRAAALHGSCHAACSGRFSNSLGAHVAALLQWQFLKLHTSALVSH
jgi:hypothetical protein